MAFRHWWGVAALALAGAAHSGYQEGMDLLVARDFARARAEFEADKANPRSVYQLAVMAREGLGEPRDLVRAAGLLKQAADLGHQVAQLEYAYALGNGNGVDGNGAEAVRILEKLVAAGHAEGTATLGRVLRFGWWGQAKDEARSTELLRKAFEQGEASARVPYAQALLEGIGTAKDPAKAMALLREGVDRGNAAAQLEMARLLTLGADGVTKDEVAGLELYRKVAESADRTAQYAIGMAYLNGRGIARDEKAAVRWLDASARQGWPFAQVQLAELYRTGRGVPVLRGEAYFWYSIAARSTVTSVVERANAQRTAMSPTMSPQQLSTVSARAVAFKTQPAFRPRATPLEPPAKGDRFELGGTSLRVPAPAGFVNGWETVERMQQAYPNDPDLAMLMVLHSAEDMDRAKLGVPGRMRSIELSRQTPDDSIKVTTPLFGEVKKQVRRTLESPVNARWRTQATLRDDDDALSVLRAGEGDRIDAVSVVRVREKVVLLVYSGYEADQRGALAELVQRFTDEMLAANRGGLFGR